MGGPPLQRPLPTSLLRPLPHRIRVDLRERGPHPATQGFAADSGRVLDQAGPHAGHEVLGDHGRDLVGGIGEFFTDDLGSGVIHHPVGHRFAHRREGPGEFLGPLHPLLRRLLRHPQRAGDQRGRVQAGHRLGHGQVQQGPVLGFDGLGVGDRGHQLVLAGPGGVDHRALAGEFSDQLGQRSFRQPSCVLSDRFHALLSLETDSNTSTNVV